MSKIANIYDSYLFTKNDLKWLLLVQNGLLWVQNNTNYEIGQNSPKQSWVKILILEYILIF